MNQAASAPVSVDFATGAFAHGGALLFDDLRLTLPAATWTAILGPSGAGKSTLLRMVAGLAGSHTQGAGQCAYMAQTDLLLPWASVLDNVMLGARLRGQPPDRARALALLDAVGLTAARGLRPAALSGGMRQRAALARTLMEDRPLVLMDEPFSALDAITRLRLQELARRLLAGRTVLLVTHDPLEALRLGDRVMVLSGRPARLGPVLEPPGTAPRALDDPEILRLQGDLLARLRDAHSEDSHIADFQA